MVFDEMPDYGQVMQNFIRDQEEQLPHVSDSRRHNQIIDYLQNLADAYSYDFTGQQRHDDSMRCW